MEDQKDTSQDPDNNSDKKSGIKTGLVIIAGSLLLVGGAYWLAGRSYNIELEEYKKTVAAKDTITKVVSDSLHNIVTDSLTSRGDSLLREVNSRDYYMRDLAKSKSLVLAANEKLPSAWKDFVKKGKDGSRTLKPLVRTVRDTIIDSIPYPVNVPGPIEYVHDTLTIIDTHYVEIEVPRWKDRDDKDELNKLFNTAFKKLRKKNNGVMDKNEIYNRYLDDIKNFMAEGIDSTYLRGKVSDANPVIFHNYVNSLGWKMYGKQLTRNQIAGLKPVVKDVLTDILRLGVQDNGGWKPVPEGEMMSVFNIDLDSTGEPNDYFIELDYKVQSK